MPVFKTFSQASPMQPVSAPALMSARPVNPPQLQNAQHNALNMQQQTLLQQLRMQELMQRMENRQHGTGKELEAWVKQDAFNRAMMQLVSEPGLKRDYDNAMSLPAQERIKKLNELKAKYVEPVAARIHDENIRANDMFKALFSADINRAQLEHEEKTRDKAAALIPNLQKGAYSLYSTIRNLLPWTDTRQIAREQEEFNKAQDAKTAYGQYQRELQQAGVPLLDRTEGLGGWANVIAEEALPLASYLLPGGLAARLGARAGMTAFNAARLGTGVGAATGGALGSSSSDVGYANRLNLDPNLTEEQRQQAMSSAWRAGNALIGGAAGAIAPNAAGFARNVPGLSRIATGIDTLASASPRLAGAANASLGLAGLSAAQVPAGNFSYAQATNQPNLDVLSGLQDALVSSAVTGGLLGLFTGYRPPVPRPQTLTPEPTYTFDVPQEGRRMINDNVDMTPLMRSNSSPERWQAIGPQGVIDSQLYNIPLYHQENIQALNNNLKLPHPELGIEPSVEAQRNYAEALRNPLTNEQLANLPTHYRENYIAALRGQDLPFKDVGLWSAEKAEANYKAIADKGIPLPDLYKYYTPEQILNIVDAVHRRPLREPNGLDFLNEPKLTTDNIPLKYAANRDAAFNGKSLPYQALGLNPPADIMNNYTEVSNNGLDTGGAHRKYIANNRAALQGDPLPYPEVGLWTTKVRDQNYKEAQEANIDVGTILKWSKARQDNFEAALHKEPLPHPELEIISGQQRTAKPANGNSTPDSGVETNPKGTNGATQPPNAGQSQPTNTGLEGQGLGQQPSQASGANESNIGNTQAEGLSPRVSGDRSSTAATQSSTQTRTGDGSEPNATAGSPVDASLTANASQGQSTSSPVDSDSDSSGIISFASTEAYIARDVSKDFMDYYTNTGYNRDVLDALNFYIDNAPLEKLADSFGDIIKVNDKILKTGELEQRYGLGRKRVSAEQKRNYGRDVYKTRIFVESFLPDLNDAVAKEVLSKRPQIESLLKASRAINQPQLINDFQVIFNKYNEIQSPLNTGLNADTLANFYDHIIESDTPVELSSIASVRCD